MLWINVTLLHGIIAWLKSCMSLDWIMCWGPAQLLLNGRVHNVTLAKNKDIDYILHEHMRTCIIGGEIFSSVSPGYYNMLAHGTMHNTI